MKRTTYKTRLNILICLFILFIIFIFSSQTVIAEPNTNLNVLLYSEDKEGTATHLKLYTSDEITPNKRIIYSVVITASVPSPLGPGNVIDQGLIALVVPETTEVDYQNIKVYGAPTPDSNKYVEYQPESESTKDVLNIIKTIATKFMDLALPCSSLVFDLAPLYKFKPGDSENSVDLNQYDIVKVNWEAPRLKYWQKVQIDVPVHLGDDAEIGLYAYWQSRASSADGTGPVHARDNISNFNNFYEQETRKSLVEFNDLYEKSRIYKIAVFTGIDDKKLYKELIEGYGIFGIKNIFDISSLTSKDFALYKGIIIDACMVDCWRNNTFYDFIDSEKMEALLDDYVKNGGILIIAYNTNTSIDSLRAFPNNEILWDNLKIKIDYGTETVRRKVAHTNYLFNVSNDLVDYIKKNLIDSKHNPSHWGLIHDNSWNRLISIEQDGLARLIEKKIGKGRFLICTGPHISLWPERYKFRKVFLEGFLNYIFKNSEIELIIN